MQVIQSGAFSFVKYTSKNRKSNYKGEILKIPVDEFDFFGYTGIKREEDADFGVCRKQFPEAYRKIRRDHSG